MILEREKFVCLSSCQPRIITCLVILILAKLMCALHNIVAKSEQRVARTCVCRANHRGWQDLLLA